MSYDPKRLFTRNPAVPRWPRAAIDSEDPGQLAIERLWRAWWESRKASDAAWEAEALREIAGKAVKPAPMFRLWLESELGGESELAGAIWQEIEVRAAEEEGRARPRPRTHPPALAAVGGRAP